MQVPFHLIRLLISGKGYLNMANKSIADLPVKSGVGTEDLLHVNNSAGNTDYILAIGALFDASAISFQPTEMLSSTDLQSAMDEAIAKVTALGSGYYKVSMDPVTIKVGPGQEYLSVSQALEWTSNRVSPVYSTPSVYITKISAQPYKHFTIEVQGDYVWSESVIIDGKDFSHVVLKANETIEVSPTLVGPALKIVGGAVSPVMDIEIDFTPVTSYSPAIEVLSGATLRVEHLRIIGTDDIAIVVRNATLTNRYLDIPYTSTAPSRRLATGTENPFTGSGSLVFDYCNVGLFSFGSVIIMGGITYNAVDFNQSQAAIFSNSSVVLAVFRSFGIPDSSATGLSSYNSDLVINSLYLIGGMESFGVLIMNSSKLFCRNFKCDVDGIPLTIMSLSSAHILSSQMSGMDGETVTVSGASSLYIGSSGGGSLFLPTGSNITVGEASSVSMSNISPVAGGLLQVNCYSSSYISAQSCPGATYNITTNVRNVGGIIRVIN